jgi:hypothetical protein
MPQAVHLENLLFWQETNYRAFEGMPIGIGYNRIL